MFPAEFWVFYTQFPTIRTKYGNSHIAPPSRVKTEEARPEQSAEGSGNAHVREFGFFLIKLLRVLALHPFLFAFSADARRDNPSSLLARSTLLSSSSSSAVRRELSAGSSNTSSSAFDTAKSREINLTLSIFKKSSPSSVHAIAAIGRRDVAASIGPAGIVQLAFVAADRLKAQRSTSYITWEEVRHGGCPRISSGGDFKAESAVKFLFTAAEALRRGNQTFYRQLAVLRTSSV
ncbi:hypothetical protein ACLOJK_007457 [Asimina triloba]